ncbi:peroxisome biogenesis protein 12 isoform X1 [Populus alba x Populus x berolinensis]|uniref:Peroxisome biogenesis protein 12 n=1 Tax=Populus alba x Populus x berolinensis TaxID=444605 RepID=A0AAD6L789_9ROSI|nr:peroxisome biogenesis protein 12 isoform X1 [Populus alba x Populus x berolinensis]
MLFQVGGQGTRPTFFEMAAAQQLPASLRAALTYSIGVLALRRPFLHKVLDHEDEFFSLLMLVLETHSLRTTDASFSESLYGLRRRTVKIRVKKEDARPNSGDGIQHSGLEKHQRTLSVVFLVVLPYFKSKLYSIYNKEREARLQASLWGNGDETVEDAEYFSGGEASLVSRETTIRARLMKKIQKIMFVCYPWLHASSEGMSFAYQLLYLLDATGFYSLGLHALGIHVCRATGQELMDTTSRISKIRSNERERLHGPPWLKTLQGALLSCAYTMLDYAQTGLIAAVFIFKMMEWWYQSAEERMSAPTVYPPPPPPPAPKVRKELFSLGFHDGVPPPPHSLILLQTNSHILVLY